MLLIPTISVFDQLANCYAKSIQFLNDVEKLMQSGMSKKDAESAAAADYLISVRKSFELNDGKSVEYKLTIEQERLAQESVSPSVLEGSVTC